MNKRYFNIDLHISVIADLKSTFEILGSKIEDKCLSGHSFVFNRVRDRLDVIGRRNWMNLDSEMCDSFYKRYKDELGSYDGFVCTYPPSFALLYEKFNKPIVLQVPIRFETPFQNNPSRLKWFIDFLKNGIDNKQIIPVCNSLYDKKYCEMHTDREWTLIPNICDYTGINYIGGDDYIVYGSDIIKTNINNIKSKEQYLGVKYSWNKFNTVKGVIHFPYNISTMSVFEQYTANIPLFFPTPEFNIELYKQGKTLSQISWNGKKMDTIEWIKYADCYNEDWMPHINYFNSLDEVYDLYKKTDLKDVSSRMKEFNVIRKQRIYGLWKNILDNLK